MRNDMQILVRKMNPVALNVVCVVLVSSSSSHFQHFSSKSRKNCDGVSLIYGFSIKVASSKSAWRLRFHCSLHLDEWENQLIQFSAAETRQEKNLVIASRIIYVRRVSVKNGARCRYQSCWKRGKRKVTHECERKCNFF